jgi:hypothetical protein
MSYVIALGLISLVVIYVGSLFGHTGLFIAWVIVGMSVGRRVGWGLSRAFLYPAPAVVSLVICLLWGGLVALLLHLLIQQHQPGLLVKLVIGFGAGAYTSIPNFGLVDEATIPDHAAKRHMLVSNLALWTFILSSAALAFLG